MQKGLLPNNTGDPSSKREQDAVDLKSNETKDTAFGLQLTLQLPCWLTTEQIFIALLLAGNKSQFCYSSSTKKCLFSC